MTKDDFLDKMEELENISNEVGSLLRVVKESCECNDYYNQVQVLEIAICKQDILAEQLFMQSIN